MTKEKAINNYKTHQIRIKKGHLMYPYFQEMTKNAKNMYNTTNFYIRQVYTGLTQTKALQPLQLEVLDYAASRKLGTIRKTHKLMS